MKTIYERNYNFKKVIKFDINIIRLISIQSQKKVLKVLFKYHKNKSISKSISILGIVFEYSYSNVVCNELVF